MSTTPPASAPEVRAIASAQTHPLRSAILRPGYPPEAAIFLGDDDAQTAHFGCFVDGAIVAIASIYVEVPPASLMAEMETAFGPAALAHPWRLRGMAVAAEVQRSGYGQAVLDACVAHLAIHGGTLLWCNARTTALGFYERAGFTVLGDEFDIPTVGPHYVMARGVGGAEDE